MHDAASARPATVHELRVEPFAAAWAATLPTRGPEQQAVVLIDGCAPIPLPMHTKSDIVLALESAPERTLLLVSEDKGIQQRLSPPVMYLLDAARQPLGPIDPSRFWLPDGFRGWVTGPGWAEAELVVPSGSKALSVRLEPGGDLELTIDPPACVGDEVVLEREPGLIERTARLPQGHTVLFRSLPTGPYSVHLRSQVATLGAFGATVQVEAGVEGRVRLTARPLRRLAMRLPAGEPVPDSLYARLYTSRRQFGLRSIDWPLHAVQEGTEGPPVAEVTDLDEDYRVVELWTDDGRQAVMDLDENAYAHEIDVRFDAPALLALGTGKGLPEGAQVVCVESLRLSGYGDYRRLIGRNRASAGNPAAHKVRVIDSPELEQAAVRVPIWPGRWRVFLVAAGGNLLAEQEVELAPHAVKDLALGTDGPVHRIRLRPVDALGNPQHGRIWVLSGSGQRLGPLRLESERDIDVPESWFARGVLFWLPDGGGASQRLQLENVDPTRDLVLGS